MRILQGFGPKSKWKHGNQSWLLFITRVVFFSVKFGTVAERLVVVSYFHKQLVVSSLTEVETRKFPFTALQPNRQAPYSSTDKRLSSQPRLDGTFDKYSTPRRLTTDEIPQVINDFRKASRNAIESGGLIPFMKNLVVSSCYLHRQSTG